MGKTPDWSLKPVVEIFILVLQIDNTTPSTFIIVVIVKTWKNYLYNHGHIVWTCWTLIQFIYKIVVLPGASMVAQLVKNHLQCGRPWFDSWVRKIPWRRDRRPTPIFLGFPGGSDGKELPPAMWEIWVRSLGWKDLLEEGMTTHSSILAWRIPMDRGTWQAVVHGVAKSWTQLSD